MIYLDLILNLTLLVALSVVSGFVDKQFPRRTSLGVLLQGALFGAVAVIGMLRPLVLGPGLIFDGRSVMVSLCALYFGPLAAVVAGGAALVCRVLLGGIGTMPGVLTILFSVALGLQARYLFQPDTRPPSSMRLYGLGLIVHLAMLVAQLSLPNGEGVAVVQRLAAPVLVLYPLATILVGKILSDQIKTRQTIQALAASEERHQFSMEATNDGLWDWNLTTDETYFSPAYYTMLGYEFDEFPALGVSWKELIHPEDRDRTLEANLECIDGPRTSFEVEYRMLGKDRQWHWILGRGKCVARNAAGKALRLVGTHVDLTERKRAEEERANLEAKLVQAQKMEAVGRLAGGVAHDFNNYLTVILGHTELALERVQPPDPLESHLQQISEAAARSADLTRQLLAFARKQTAQPEVLDLNATISGLVKMLDRLLGENIALEWSPDSNVWPVRIDPTQIDQVLANLCVNARDAIADVGQISIRTANVTVSQDTPVAGISFGEYVRLSVIDTGSGMDPSTLKRIFEPFFTTKASGKGTGLGLAMVYGIVEQNSGSITVRSAPGEGTTFDVYLPRYLGEPKAAGTTADEARDSTGNETILLVEDEPAILEIVATILRRLGYNVLCAATPPAALHVSEAYPSEIHLLLTDVVMPGMNGKDLSEALLARRPSLRRLFMSGYTDDVIAHHGVLDNGVGFIEKPFSKDSLGILVRQILDSPA